ncbi:MAG: PH domain-containing protein [Dehalococcoidales bacterium]
MIGWILGFTAAIVLVSVYFASQANPQPNVRIGVSLPHEALNDIEVKKITGDYRSALRKAVLIAAVIGIPPFFLLSYVSLAMLFMFVWIGVVFYAANRIFIVYHDKLIVLKQNNRWFAKNARIITVDTEVSRLKDTMPISGRWFIIPVLLSLLPFLFAYLERDNNLILITLGVVSLTTSLISIWLYTLVRRESTLSVSRDTRVNMAYNTSRKNTLSRGWFLFAFSEAIILAVMSFLIMQYDVNVVPVIIAILLTSVLGLIIIITSYQKASQTQQRLKNAENDVFYVDDDSGWENGFLFYNNPYDERTMVEKRSGYGQTINIATKKGKAFIYGTFAFSALVLIGVTGVLLWADFGEIEMGIVSDNNRIVIQAPMYGYEFNASEIIDVAITNDPPRGIRTNGIATDRYLLGNFNINDYGKSKLYIVGDAPYIVVQLEDLYIFINGKSENQTLEYFNLLKGLQAH